ncbi:unnamed protein product [Vicia faba]|uniref:Uncharacterized protein n=1 Tax=Vicia faba TaxID=3906 RepID=A0AAV1AUH9_VICFA|nr:unnamed protein product [Vicia faba]
MSRSRSVPTTLMMRNRFDWRQRDEDGRSQRWSREKRGFSISFWYRKKEQQRKSFSHNISLIPSKSHTLFIIGTASGF